MIGGRNHDQVRKENGNNRIEVILLPYLRDIN
jgi:hypothetical protein